MYKLFMALRYLRSHRVIYFSIAGVAVGITIMIIVTSVMGGFSRDIRARIRGMQSHLMVKKREQDLVILDYPKLVEKLRKIPHVVRAAPRVEYVAWLGRYGRQWDVNLMGIDPAQEGEDSDLARFFKRAEKSFHFRYEDGRRPVLPPIVAGRELHRSMLFEGAEVGLTTVRRDTVPRICNQNFEVVGAFQSGMSEYDQKTIFMPLEAAQNYLKMVDSINYIAITVDDYAVHGVEAKRAILAALHEHEPCDLAEAHDDSGLCGRYVVLTWEQAKRNLLQAVAIEKGIQIVILFCIVLVAGFNIVAIYTLMVKSKVREIGILRALGANRAGVAQVFLISGFLCGIAGCFVGIVVGLKASYNLSHIADAVEEGSRKLGDYARAQRTTVTISPGKTVRHSPLATKVLIGGLAAGALLIGAAILASVAGPGRVRAGILDGLLIALLLLASYGLLVNGTSLLDPTSALSGVASLLSMIFLFAIPAALVAYWTALARDSGWEPLRWGFRGLAMLAALHAGVILAGLAALPNFWELVFGECSFNLIGAPVFALLAYAAARSTREQTTMIVMLALTGGVVMLLSPLMWVFCREPWVISLFPKDVYYLDRIPSEVSYPTIALIVGMTMVVSILASVYPAYRAASYDPVEAMRRE